jgi:hypothetical protein
MVAMSNAIPQFEASAAQAASRQLDRNVTVASCKVWNCFPRCRAPRGAWVLRKARSAAGNSLRACRFRRFAGGAFKV